jgi:hypothetical protein
MQWKNLREQSVMTVSRSESIRKFTTIIAVLFVAGTFASDLAQSQEQKAGPMDEKAMQILQGMSDYLAGAKTLSFRARTLFDEVRKSGIKIKSARTIHVVLQRPSSLRVLSIADNGAARTSWFDGSKLTVLMRDTNQFMELEYEGNIDGMLDELIENHEAQLPLADLAYSDIAKNFKENLISAGYLGIKLVNGIKCHHLSFESTGADWQIWIQADATPLPRRFAAGASMARRWTTSSRRPSPRALRRCRSGSSARGRGADSTSEPLTREFAHGRWHSDNSFGLEADAEASVPDVRFTPESGHCERLLRCPLRAKSGHSGKQHHGLPG